MFKYIIDVVYVSFNVVYVLFIHCLYDIYIYINNMETDLIAS